MATFEDRLTALDAVVERLERGELTLEDSVRLFEEARVGELDHLVADGSRTDRAGEGRLRERAGAYRLASGDVAVDDRGEDLALTGCDGAGHGW